jgi:hypothetical protein
VFERFRAAFRLAPPDQGPGEAWHDDRFADAKGYPELARRFAGCTFENGLYRLHDAVSGPRALAYTREAFPDFAHRLCPFGYDWLGRQYAVDSGRVEGGEPQLLLLEPATGKALEIPLPFATFHDEELVDYRDEVLASDYFGEWSRANPTELPLRPDQCVGCAIPLFLGGSDAIESLEVTDLEVYWSLNGQLRIGTLRLPEGTQITDVSIRD